MHSSTTPISIETSSLNEIAEDLGFHYYWLPFTDQLTPEGLLDYASAREELRQNKTTQHIRKIHGLPNVCRVAVSMKESFFAFYQKYRADFSPEIQKEIAEFETTPLLLKKCQVVGLLRPAGRTVDHDSGSKFAAQGKKEALYYLERIGVHDPVEREALASLIELSEKTNRITLSVALLADAMLVETFRDGSERDRKAIHLTQFFTYKLLSQNGKRPRFQTVNAFINLCCSHAKVILKQQQFLTAGILRYDGVLLHPDWPLRDLTFYATSVLSLSGNCFNECLKDFQTFRHDDRIPTNLLKVIDVKHYIFHYIETQKLVWNPNGDNAHYISCLIHFVRELRKELITDGQEVWPFTAKDLLPILEKEHRVDIENYFLETCRNAKFTRMDKHYHGVFYNEKTAKRFEQALCWYALGKDDSFKSHLMKCRHSQLGMVYLVRITALQRDYLAKLRQGVLLDEKQCNRPQFIVHNFSVSLSQLTYKGLKSIPTQSSSCYVEQFISGITATPAQPDTVKHRKIPHKTWTAKNDQRPQLFVEKKEKNKTAVTAADRKERQYYSKPQPFSIHSDGKDFPVFCREDNRTKLVGFVFDPLKIQVVYAFLENVGSVNRPWENAWYQEAFQFLNSHFKDKTYFTWNTKTHSYDFKIDEFVKLIPSNEHNEVIGRLTIKDESFFAVGLFSDSMPAKYIALAWQEMAEEKTKRAIPIVMYNPSAASSKNPVWDVFVETTERREAKAMLSDYTKWIDAFDRGDYEFLMVVEDVHRALSFKYQGKSILFHLLEKGLYYIANRLFTRSKLPGTLLDYLIHKMDCPQFSGFKSDWITLKLIYFAAEKGQLAMLKAFCKKKPSTLNVSGTVSIYPGKNETLLYAAACEGHLEIVDYLLTHEKVHPAQLSHRAEYARIGVLPIQMAVYFGHAEIAKMLLSKGSPNACKNATGDSLVDMAVKNNDAEMFGILHDNFKSSNDRCLVEDLTVWRLVGKLHSFNIVEKMLEKHVLPANVAYELGYQDGSAEGNTFYHHLIRLNRTALFKSVLSAFSGVVNFKNKKEQTLLHYAVLHESLEMMKIVLERNPSFDHQDEQGRQPFDLVYTMKDRVKRNDMARVLLQAKASRVNLDTLLAEGDAELFQLVTQYPAAIHYENKKKAYFGTIFHELLFNKKMNEFFVLLDILRVIPFQAKDESGYLLLHVVTCMVPDLERIKKVYDRTPKFVLNEAFSTSNTITPLHLAVYTFGNPDVVRFFAERHSESVNTLDPQHNSPLQWCLKVKDYHLQPALVECMRILMRYDKMIDPHAEFHVHFKQNNVPMCELFVTHPRFFSKKAEHGYSILYGALLKNDRDRGLFDFLMKPDGSRHELDEKMDEYPMHLAVTQENIPIVQQLLKKFPKSADCFDKNKKTPLQKALKKRHFELSTLLMGHDTVTNLFDSFVLKAMKERDQTMLDFLSKHKRAAEEKDKEGNTILQQALLKKDEALFYLLCEYPNWLNLNAVNNNMQKAIHLAILWDREHVLQIIISLMMEQGMQFDVNCFNCAVAVKNLNLMVMMFDFQPIPGFAQWFVDHRVLLPFEGGMHTPVHTAVKARHLTLLHDLILLGHDVLVKNKEGKPPSALGFAVEIKLFCYEKKLMDKCAVTQAARSSPNQFAKSAAVIHYDTATKLKAAKALVQFVLNKHNASVLNGLEDVLVKDTLGEVVKALKNHPDYQHFLPKTLVEYKGSVFVKM